MKDKILNAMSDKSLIFIEIRPGMSVNRNEIKQIMTTDMRNFHVIIDNGRYTERYKIDKELYFFLKRLGVPNGKKSKNKKK